MAAIDCQVFLCTGASRIRHLARPLQFPLSDRTLDVHTGCSKCARLNWVAVTRQPALGNGRASFSRDLSNRVGIHWSRAAGIAACGLPTFNSGTRGLPEACFLIMGCSLHFIDAFGLLA